MEGNCDPSLKKKKDPAVLSRDPAMRRNARYIWMGVKMNQGAVLPVPRRFLHKVKFTQSCSSPWHLPRQSVSS